MPKKTRILSKRRLSFNASPTKTPGNCSETPCDRTMSPDLAWERDLSGKWWSVYEVSPLSDFNYGKLGVYSKKLSEGLEATFSTKTDSSFTSQFTTRPSMKISSEVPDGILLEVVSGNNKLVYRGYFLNCSKNYSYQDNFTNLPTLLVASTEKFAQQVHDLLCKFFDCVIHHVRFTMFDLISQLCALSFTYFNKYSLKNKVLSLQYDIPGCSPGKNTITFNLHAEDTSTVLKLLLEHFTSSPNTSDAELYEAFYERITTHIQRTYQIYLTSAQLTKVVLPVSIITIQGKVKWLKEDIAMMSLELLEQPKLNSLI